MDTESDTIVETLFDDIKLSGGNGTNVTDSSLPPMVLYRPIMILTGVFGGLFIILPLFVRKSPNQVIIRCSIMLSLFCLWIFWVTVYIGQMNPIMGPRMHNTTVAWIAYAKGDPAKLSETREETPDYY